MPSLKFLPWLAIITSKKKKTTHTHKQTKQKKKLIEQHDQEIICIECLYWLGELKRTKDTIDELQTWLVGA